MNIIVPATWINANIKNHQLVIDPLVTGTNTLAQSAITGSGQSTLASCGFDNYCSYNLAVTQPAATTITDVSISFGYLASGLCSYSDGGMAFIMGACAAPSTTSLWYCNSSGQGSCNINTGMFSYFSSCLPPPSCNTQNLTFALHLYRTCKGNSGCDGSCIGAASPFTVTLTCHTVEFTVPSGGSGITITGDTCQGQPPLNALVTGYGGVPPYNYQWSLNSSGTPVYATGNSTTFNFPTAGAYPVYVSVTDACNNTFETSKIITIDPPITATANITICASQLPYTWNGQTITAGGSAAATYTAPSLVTGCDSTTTLNLTVNALPAINSQPANASILINGNANFTIAASGTGPLTYQWQVNTGSGFTSITDGGVYSNSATASLTISNTPLSMNGYSYLCIVSGVCTPAATSNVALLSVNKNAQTISSPSFTSGSTVVYTYGDAASSAGATASSGLPVSYSSSDTTVAVIDATGQISIRGAGTTQITVSQPGNATYLAADATLTIQINKKDLLVTADDITRPYGESNPPLTMQYSGFVYGQNQSVITEPVLSTSVVTTTLPGTYPITLTGGSAANYNLILTNGTFIVTGAVVSINQQPDNKSSCAGDNVTFKTAATAASPIVNIGYQWQQSSNGSNWQDISGATSDTFTVSNDNSLYVRCLITAPGTNLPTQAALFTVNPLPNVQAAKLNDIDCNHGSADLMASGAVNYTWYPATGLSDPQIANPVATPDGDVTYVVTGTDDNGCRNADSIQVKVTTAREGENVMANAFTPNGDGKNDCFGIRYWGEIQSIQFDIFNRYGALVFHSNKPGECWDGRSGGQDQPTGTYVYFINAVTQCGVITRKGTVILIR
jgi:gliding motility-associated-like protein